jgi:hypothetical protein
VVVRLPLLDNLLPARVSFELFASLAAVLAFGLDDLHGTPARGLKQGRSRRRRRNSALAAGLTVIVLVGTQLPEWPLAYGTTPVAVPPGSIRAAYPAGDPVTVTFPLATETSPQPMLWQAEDEFRFRIVGGYGYHPAHPSRGPSILYPLDMVPNGLEQFLAAQDPPSFYGGPLPVSPHLVRATRAALANYHVGLVIVDRSLTGSAAVEELFRDALGPPTRSAGAFSIWTGWHGTPSHQSFTNLYTSVLRPFHGALLSGTAVLDAGATDDLKVIEIEFLLTNALDRSTIIAKAGLSYDGWIALWNSALVPNGTYRLQSVAYDTGGYRSVSPAVTVSVRNDRG